MARHYWIETLGCPKNQVDSEKLAGTLVADGYRRAVSMENADLVVVNTCAFVEAARQESIETILEIARSKSADAKLVVTGCLAERHGTSIAEAMPEVDLVVGFGVPVSLAPARRGHPVPEFDLLNLPRPAPSAPWAYVKVAEGCDRNCGFCAIPQFRGRQRSRSQASILEEVDSFGDGVKEIVLVAQDLASWGMDRGARERRGPGGGRRPLVSLVDELRSRVERVRLLYLYPSTLDDGLIRAVLDTGVPYFDLSIQHVSRPLLQKMRRWGDGRKFLERISHIRDLAPEAAFRSSFILGYPGETEKDHDSLLWFLEEAQLDWAGFFTFSEEEGTYAAELPDKVPHELALERLRECSEIHDEISASKRSALVSSRVCVLVDEPRIARSYREAPEIDGIVHVPVSLEVGRTYEVLVTGSAGPDLWAQ